MLRESKEDRRRKLLATRVAQAFPIPTQVSLSQVVELGWSLVKAGALPGGPAEAGGVGSESGAPSPHQRQSFLNRCAEVHAEHTATATAAAPRGGGSNRGSPYPSVGTKRTWKEITHSRQASDVDEICKIYRVLKGASSAADSRGGGGRGGSGSSACSACGCALRTEEEPRFYLNTLQRLWKPMCMLQSEETAQEELKIFCSVGCEQKWNTTLVCPVCEGTDRTLAREIGFPLPLAASLWYPSGGDEQSRALAFRAQAKVSLCVACQEIMIPRDPWPHHIRTPELHALHACSTEA